jgi:hypothetical protein
LLGRRAKTGILVAALLVLAVEGVLLARYYDRYYSSSGAAPGGAPSSGRAALEETTAPAEATNPDGRAADGEASFVHRANDANSRGDYTYLDDPRINGDPDAVVLAEPAPERGGDEDSGYGHNVGVWYEPTKERWAIFNQDLAAVPAGTAFEVAVPPADRGFVHRAAPANTVGNATYIDDPLLNGEPGAEVSVTQNWNPGGGNGVYNDRPVGALYDGDVGRWLVYNEDGAPMPEGAAFNVAVSGPPSPRGSGSGSHPQDGLLRTPSARSSDARTLHFA